MDDGSGGGDNGGWVNVVDKWTGVADITRARLSRNEA
jgi:hypothetical protein